MVRFEVRGLPLRFGLWKGRLMEIKKRLLEIEEKTQISNTSVSDLFIHELLELHEFYGWHPWLFIPRVQSNAISVVLSKMPEIRRDAILTRLPPVIDKKKTQDEHPQVARQKHKLADQFIHELH